MATRALVFDLVGRDKSLGRTFDQMGRKSKELGRSFSQAGDQASRATEKLRLGVDKASLHLRQAEVAAGKATASHARAVKLFGADSDQASRAALRVAGTQVRVRDATLKAADAQDALSGSANKAQQVARVSSDRWGHLGTSLGRVAKTAAIAGGAIAAVGVVGAARFAAAGVKAAASFDQTMRQFATVTDLPKAQLSSMRELALKMGADTSFSASQAGKAMLDLAKGGLTAAEIKGGVLKQTLVLAAAGGIELAEAGTYMANTLNMFGLKAKDAGLVAAALAGGANASSASVESLGLALAQTGLGAKRAGLSLNEAVGVLAGFDSVALKGSDAGTSFKTMLTSLVGMTARSRKKMHELNLEFFDSKGKFLGIAEIAGQLRERLGKLTDKQREQAYATIFGSDATRAASALYDLGRGGVEKYTRATEDLAAAEKLAKTNTEGAAGSFEQLKGAIETISIRIGDPLLRPLADLAKLLAAKLPEGLAKTSGFFKRLWDNAEPVRVALGRLWESVKVGAEAIGGALASAFQAIGPSASETQGRISGFASFIRNTLVPAVKAFSSWATDEGIPGFLDFADQFVNNVMRPVGKATLSTLALVSRATANWMKVMIGAAGSILHGFAVAFQFVPVLGDQLKKTDESFSGFADQAISNGFAVADAMEAARDVGGAALDNLGENLRGARDRYEEFQRQAKIPVMVKVAANVTDLALKFKQAQIKAGEFRIRANEEIAKVTSKPAREKLQQIVDDLSRGKIQIGEFRERWNAEMRKLANASRIAAVVARLKSPEVLKSDIAKAKHLIGFGATGGRVNGEGTETSDSNLFRLSRNEHIVSAREVHGAGGHDAVERQRALWRGAPGLAGGGPALQVHGSGTGGLGGRIQAQTTAVDRFMQGVGQWVAAKANAKLNRDMGALGGGTGAGGWQWQIGVLRRAFPGLALISGFRPGARTHATGAQSYHAIGRAVDVPPRMDVFDWIRANYGARSKELIFSPAGGRQLKNGRPHMYSGVTRADHWDHAHWAFHQGGTLPEDVVGVGRSGTTYSMQRGETVSPRGGGDIHVHLHGPVYGDPNALVAKVRTGIKEAQRRSGVPAARQLA